jgi:excisionase family DNA binding protein
MASNVVPDPARAAAGLVVVADGFARVPEAEKFLGISRAKLYAIMDAGDLAYAKVGRSRRIPWVALREYAAQCLVGR